MIEFININKDAPFLKFKQKYDDATNANQKNIEAICISSYSNKFNEVNARYVNLKILNNKNFIFFSNYNSPKSQEFTDHDQITAVIFWNNINVQIRIKALIQKTSADFNSNYFLNRANNKNALAISSNQSQAIDSYETVIKNYNKSLETDNLNECPDYWGGYSFIPYYFEFWEGHNSRLNKREAYEKKGSDWHSSFLQP